jgi:hypothetical protein
MRLFLFVHPSALVLLRMAMVDDIAIQGSSNCDISYLRTHPAALENGAEVRIESCIDGHE